MMKMVCGHALLRTCGVHTRSGGRRVSGSTTLTPKALLPCTPLLDYNTPRLSSLPETYLERVSVPLSLTLQVEFEGSEVFASQSVLSTQKTI